MNGQDDPRDEFEARLRESLQRDGEQIRPHGDGLARIRERTAGRRSTGRGWLMAGAIGVATATAIVGAFFVSTDLLDRSSAPGPVATPTVRAETHESDPASPTPSPEQSPDQSPRESPSESPSKPAEQQPPVPTTTPDGPASVRVTVPVYYLGDTSAGPRLFREFHDVESAAPEAVTALNEMLGTAPHDADYSTPWAPGSRALSVDASGAQITVDLSREVLDTSVPPETAELMLQQLVYTVQAALQSTEPVQILVAGVPVSDLSGAPVDEPLRRADAVGVQAMTWVITPSQGASVSRPFEVTGVANAFEATVLWQLVQGGEVVRDGFTTAAEGMRFSEYSFTVKNVPPGDYTLRVFQESAADGSAEYVDTKDITVE